MIVSLHLAESSRQGLFFSVEKTQDILIGAMQVLLQVEIEQSGHKISRQIQEKLSYPLSRGYLEEPVLSELARRLSNRIIFLLLSTQDKHAP